MIRTEGGSYAEEFFWSGLHPHDKGGAADAEDGRSGGVLVRLIVGLRGWKEREGNGEQYDDIILNQAWGLSPILICARGGVEGGWEEGVESHRGSGR